MNEASHPDSPEEVLHKGKFLQFVIKNGWEYVKRTNCSDIVIIIAKTDEGKLIFVEQFRQPVNKRVIEFPAGLINDGTSDQNESLESGAIRELIEETGYKAERVKVLLQGPVSSGSSADLVTLVLAEGLTKTGAGGGDHTENITVHEVDYDEAESWLNKKISEGFLVEPKIYAGLYFLIKAV